MKRRPSYGPTAVSKRGLQTILGAGGVIGEELMRELLVFTNRVRLVRRHPAPPGPNMEAVGADLLNPAQASEAVRGSDVAYLVAGLPYIASVWIDQWPVIMRNVIAGCRQHGVRLVFLDNVYLYGNVKGAMTERTAANPCSRKGVVRSRIVNLLMDEIASGHVQGLIARSADLYGPGATNSLMHPLVFEQLRDRGKAVWLCSDQVPHSMVYTSDAGRAIALLGNAAEAYGQVWHLPSDPDAPTGKRFIEMAASVFQCEPVYRVIGSRILRLAGWFHRAARESVEMLYQYSEPYVFDSSKFSHRFFPATPYMKGIRETADCMVRWSRPST